MNVEIVSKIVKLAAMAGKPAPIMALHLMEEVGEFAEGVNWELGYISHKTMKEPLIGEAADVIQNVIATLSLVYPTWTAEQLAANLAEALERKTEKWQQQVDTSPVKYGDQRVRNGIVQLYTINGWVDGWMIGRLTNSY